MARKSQATYQILNLVENSKSPVSSLDIQNACINLDRATVYRGLTKLKETQKIRIVELGDGVVRYESIKDHHHHLICLKCKKIKKVNLPLEEEKHLNKLQVDFQKQSKFTSLQHSLEFFGLCQQCKPVKTVQK